MISFACLVGCSAFPELDRLVSAPLVKGTPLRFVSFGFAALTLDKRSSDQRTGWLSGKAERWLLKRVPPALDPFPRTVEELRAALDTHGGWSFAERVSTACFAVSYCSRHRARSATEARIAEM